jgi:hypothetical protein
MRPTTTKAVAPRARTSLGVLPSLAVASARSMRQPFEFTSSVLGKDWAFNVAGGLEATGQTRKRGSDQNRLASRTGSARALDGDGIVTRAGGASLGRHGSTWTVEPAKRQRAIELPRLAKGGRNRGSTRCSSRQTAVDAVAFRIVGDHKDALLRVSGGGNEGGRKDCSGEDSHGRFRR